MKTLIPKPILDEYSSALKTLKEKGRLLPKNLQMARTRATSRLITSNGQRWYTENRDQVIGELDQIYNQVITNE